jgi:hypothetical protein
MEKYYEILDSKYWVTDQQRREWHAWKQETLNRTAKYPGAGQIFRVIALISLGMLFWRLAEHPGGGNSVALNAIGLVLALSAFFAIKIYQSRERKHI